MAQQRPSPVGYDDTPFLPGSQYRVHDIARPQPRIVTPGTESSQSATGTPPSDAVVLFDGSSLNGWVGKDGQAAPWKAEHGYMEVASRTGDIRSTQTFGDCHLHVEFQTPAEVKGNSQGRGNSGVFLMGLYEFQVLDCYDNPTYADGTVGAIYGQYPPLANASRKPGEWQTYDIIWTAPRFEGDKLASPAFATVILNGVVVQYHQQLRGTTSHKVVTEYVPHPPTGPLKLQDHGDLVRYRNIWYRPLDKPVE